MPDRSSKVKGKVSLESRNVWYPVSEGGGIEPGLDGLLQGLSLLPAPTGGPPSYVSGGSGARSPYSISKKTCASLFHRFLPLLRTTIE